MQTSGKVFEVYDDHGALLRGESVSDLVKMGQALSPEQQERLPDNLFALVCRSENGDVLRKYACIDPGNTELAIRYFSKIAGTLPEDLREHVAENLKVAAGWYGLENEDFAKEAFLGFSAKAPLTSVMRGMTAYDLATNTPKKIKGNMAAIRSMEGAGNVVTPEQVQHAKLGTENPQFGFLDTNLHKEYGRGMQRMPQASVKSKTVGAESPPNEKKVAFALASVNRYPINNTEQLTKAATYFGEHLRFFQPAERREFAVNFVKQAEALRHSVPESIRLYAGEEYAPRSEIKMALDARVMCIADQTKQASVREDMAELLNHQPVLAAEKFASVLEAADRMHGLSALYDRSIPDPYVSVLAPMKLAATEMEDWSWIDGPHYVNAERLTAVACEHFATLKKTYGEDFAEEFQKDPVGTFKSLPLPHKRRIANFTSQQSANLV